MEREQIVHNPLVKHYGLPLAEGALAGLIATVPMTIFCSPRNAYSLTGNNTRYHPKNLRIHLPGG